MNLLWGVFQKRVVDLNSAERVVLALVIMIGLCLVMIALSIVVQIARRFEDAQEQGPKASRLIRKGIGHVADTDYRPEHARPAHTD